MLACLHLQLEAWAGTSTALQQASHLAVPSSLEHCCELLRHDVGADVIHAVEDALWAHAPHAPNQYLTFVGGGYEIMNTAADCSQFSSALDKSNCNRCRSIDLYLTKAELQHPICTTALQDNIRLHVSEQPCNQMTGADVANFIKVLYKCYGIVVRDLREKGFEFVMKGPAASKDLATIGQQPPFGYDTTAIVSMATISPFWD